MIIVNCLNILFSLLDILPNCNIEKLLIIIYLIVNMYNSIYDKEILQQMD